MREIVFVTEFEYEKAERTFRSAGSFDVRPAPAAEEPLADAVTAQQSRAVIVGSQPYRGPLYEALATTAAGRGAIIARFGVGHDSVDKELARQRGVVVTNTPGVLDVSVAEHALWLVGNLARNVSLAQNRIRAGELSAPAGMELAGKTLGILGFGNIGRQVARTAHHGFQMRIIAADCRPAEELERQEGKLLDRIKEAYGLTLYTADTERVLRESDLVSIHLPATDATRHFVDAARLRVMKRGALLVNTARGSVLDEAALYDSLVDGHVAGAALDVFENEPYEPVSPDKDLRTLDNVLLTPHIGSNTVEANHRMAEAALWNVTSLFAGRLNELSRVDV
jgi:lactate dehydrogenase-like 2-hydroxyacid dehydrogenase